jgi:hypothetical protein
MCEEGTEGMCEEGTEGHSSGVISFRTLSVTTKNRNNIKKKKKKNNNNNNNTAHLWTECLLHQRAP